MNTYIKNIKDREFCLLFNLNKVQQNKTSISPFKFHKKMFCKWWDEKFIFSLLFYE